MTALNCAVMPDGSAGFLLTDTTVYNPATGEILGLSSKVHALPHANTVLACRGVAAVAHQVASIANEFASFDAMINGLDKALAERLEAELAHHRNERGGLLSDDFDILLMGLSSRQAGVGAFVCTAGGGFELQQASIFIAPVLEPSEFEAAGVPFVDGQLGIRQLPGDLLKIIEAQHLAAYPFAGERKRVIGGAAILTTITRRGITHSIAKRWS